jgi:trans-aconitate 2-methyltransferase
LATNNNFGLVRKSQWDADRYQQQHSFVWQYGSSLIELAQLSAGERVLDVGCGTGELTRELRRSCPGVAAAIGMDADENMIARAREQFSEDADFFVGDARNFEISEPVDLVFSNAALHWIPPRDADRAVRCISRALRPGGRFVAEFGGKGNVQAIIRAVAQTLGATEESTNPWYYPSIAEFSTLLERHGIEVTSAVLFDRSTPLQDGPDGMRNWLRMFGSKFFEGMSPERMDELIESACDKLRPELFDGEQWQADYRRIRVVARKIG